MEKLEQPERGNHRSLRHVLWVYGVSTDLALLGSCVIAVIAVSSEFTKQSGRNLYNILYIKEFIIVTIFWEKW